MIKISNVTKEYGKQTVVNNISLEIHDGEFLGLIGHNGAGKSTLFKMMLGLLSPTKGEILVDNCSVSNANKFIDVKKTIGYLPENVTFYNNLTGYETIRFFSRLKGIPIARINEVLDQVDLIKVRHKKVSEYSKGMRQRLGFAQALLGQPRYLFLDEPTNGLDPQGVKDFYSILDELRQEKVTIIITSHLLAEIQNRVSRLVIIRHGELKAVGSLNELRKKIDLCTILKISLDDENKIEEITRYLNESKIADYSTDSCSYLRVSISREKKVELLHQLLNKFPFIENLELIEPSLEDIFLGYTFSKL